MKTPIEPSEIRKGDLIRYEGQDQSTITRAVEFCADRDGQSYLPVSLAGQHYLLDRPDSAIELPNTPTLGWLTTSRCVGTGSVPVGVPVLARWAAPCGKTSSIRKDGDTCGIAPEWVTAFIPVLLVPTEALDRLRANPLPQRDIRDFLAAVDEAGESA